MTLKKSASKEDFVYISDNYQGPIAIDGKIESLIEYHLQVNIPRNFDIKKFMPIEERNEEKK